MSSPLTPSLTPSSCWWAKLPGKGFCKIFLNLLIALHVDSWTQAWDERVSSWGMGRRGIEKTLSITCNQKCLLMSPKLSKSWYDRRLYFMTYKNPQSFLPAFQEGLGSCIPMAFSTFKILLLQKPCSAASLSDVKFRLFLKAAAKTTIKHLTQNMCEHTWVVHFIDYLGRSPGEMENGFTSWKN